MAQTIRYWNAGKTDATQAASYQDGVGGASAVPLTSNVLYVAEGSDRIVGDTTSWDKAMAYVSVTRGFSGFIGTQTTPMTIGANTNGGNAQYGVDGSTASGVEKFDYAAAGGQANIALGTGGIDVIRVDSGGQLNLVSGTLNNRLELVSGGLDVAASVNLSSRTLELYGGNSTINYRADATDPTLNVHNGTHYLRRTCGAVTLNNGTLIVDVRGETNAFTGALTVNGGTLVWLAGSMGSAQINLNSGNLIFNKATQPIDLTGASLIVVANTNIDTFGRLSSKVTWPASTLIQIKGGASIPRVSAATV